MKICLCHEQVSSFEDKRDCAYCGCPLNGSAIRCIDKPEIHFPNGSNGMPFDKVVKKTIELSICEAYKQMKENINDNVNHPSHYNSNSAQCSCGRRIECIDVTRHMNFNLGNAMKYIWRCDAKGNYLEDLKKAVWYLRDEIAKHEGKPYPVDK
jgi:hypothetical protein